MKLFVTGATGFIGSHFVNLALDRGHELIGLRRSPVSQPRVPLLKEPNWLTRPMEEVVVEDFQGSDCLVHLAAHTANVPYDSLANCLHHNLTIPLELFQKAATAGVRKFLVAGSSFEYGRSALRYDRIPTTASLEPTQSYPASKAAATVAFSAFAAEQQVDLLVARIFQVFGPGESEGRFWPSLRKAALSGMDFPMSAGTQIRDFIHVEKVALELLSRTEMLSGELGRFSIEHIGSGKEQSLREFAEYWWNEWDAKGNLILGSVPIRLGEMPRVIPKV